ncbi:SGNH/GDSL hydrolase family protein [Phyllobacterium bourgognense]|uniref:Phospholipase/lecithinase/hemolysin n=1 Tax=Phyllobacterium bourgognense TaxID=314236 RepID=A0A368YU19_9HYPH|nr:SGNH/GDSL hydrolase family protein [Phyllobacterium bourgognense]RCW83068.1 phospholipase/lecithinase/hemolysin [Phyllobacterium bourgognense]
MQKSILSTLMVCLSLLSFDAEAHEIKRVISFGDSYTDVSNGGPGSLDYPSKYQTIDSFKAAAYYPLPYALLEALGPAGTDNMLGYGTSAASINKFGGRVQFASQVNSAILIKFAKNDLVLVNIGINDADVLCNRAIDKQKCEKSGIEAADAAAVQVKKLIDNGAKTIIFAAFSSTHHVHHWFGENAPQGDAFAAAYFDELKKSLAPLTSSGAVIHLVDIAQFYDRVRLNPELYGFDYYDQPCAPKTPPCTLAEGGASWNKIEYKFGADQDWRVKHVLANLLHPSTGGLNVLAKYMADLVNYPDKVPPADILIGNAGSLNQSLEVKGTVIFHQEKDGAFEKLSGTGTLVKTGPGALTIKHGDFFKGPRQRLEGKLSVLVDRV